MGEAMEGSSNKEKGAYGVALCISYFLAIGYKVLLPFQDMGLYDLVVENDGIFERVQCKWTTHKEQSKKYISIKLSPHKKGYKKGDFDLLWIATPDICYLIPLVDILKNRKTKCNLTLYPIWKQYQVTIPD